MKTIILHGKFAEHIPNGKLRCEFNTAREAASAIESNYPGFFKLIRDKYIHVVPGKQTGGLDEVQCDNWQISSDELHIMPAAAGAGGGDNGGQNAVKAILGVALIAVAIVGTGGLAAIGGGSLAGGVSIGGTSLFGITGTQLLQVGIPMVMQAFAPSPAAQPNRVENVIFTGPLNTNKEGEVLPYVAGERVIVGGVVINTELVVQT
tara:strand:+ start:558 stop:1175 length:618 start_codon:yes stop_codon:yes gene_type:complete